MKFNFNKENIVRYFCFSIVLAYLLVGVAFPLVELVIKSLYNVSTSEAAGVNLISEESFVGIKNFVDYVSDENLFGSLLNSINIALTTTFLVLFISFWTAYALQRTQMKWKSFFRVVFMLPMFAPTMFYGLALVYLFGRQGVFTTGFFGAIPGFDIELYGPVGITISEMFYIFPPTLIIMIVSFGNIDRRLYEAADALGSSKIKTFFSVTLPGVKYGLMSAFFAGFTLVFTDFGAPKVVGGNYNVMAVDIYKRVVGQQDFYMGATISIILLVPALLSFFADRIVQRKQTSGLSAKSKPFIPKVKPKRDWLFFGLSSVFAAVIILLISIGFYASIVKMWPYDFSLNFANYFFDNTAGGKGLTPFYNSLKLALYTAVFGTVLSFISAYLVTKSREMELFKKSVSVLSLIPLALPGLVIGFSYIFFFNRPTILGLSNPFSSIYGTMAILVLSNMIHFYTVSFMTAKTALQQLDNEFDTVSESMGIPFWTTFRRVTVPVCLPAIIEIFMYYFASSMATVSAVIFLYSPKTIPATVSIINMDDAGDQAPALAMCMLIIVTNVIIKILSEVVLKKLKQRRAEH